MRIWLISSLLVLGLGCGGDDGIVGDGDGDGDGDCTAVNTQLCELACDCSTGAECTIVFSGGATATSDNRDECVGFWATFGCTQEGADQVDYPACSEALDAAQCVTVGDRTGIELPDVCNTES